MCMCVGKKGGGGRTAYRVGNLIYIYLISVLLVLKLFFFRF